MLYASGSCYELRYFFQTFSISSGIFLSRKMATCMLLKTQLWDTIFQTGLPADEAFGQISAACNYYIKSFDHTQLLGRPFRNISVFNDLKQIIKKHANQTKFIENLPFCIHPQSILEEHPGIASVCSYNYFPLSNLAIWSLGDNITDEQKVDFLNHAGQILENISPEINVIWDFSYPKLCKVKNSL